MYISNTPFHNITIYSKETLEQTIQGGLAKQIQDLIDTHPIPSPDPVTTMFSFNVAAIFESMHWNTLGYSPTCQDIKHQINNYHSFLENSLETCNQLTSVFINALQTCETAYQEYVQELPIDVIINRMKEVAHSVEMIFLTYKELQNKTQIIYKDLNDNILMPLAKENTSIAITIREREFIQIEEKESISKILTKASSCLEKAMLSTFSIREAVAKMEYYWHSSQMSCDALLADFDENILKYITFADRDKITKSIEKSFLDNLKQFSFVEEPPAPLESPIFCNGNNVLKQMKAGRSIVKTVKSNQIIGSLEKSLSLQAGNNPFQVFYLKILEIAKNNQEIIYPIAQVMREIENTQASLESLEQNSLTRALLSEK